MFSFNPRVRELLKKKLCSFNLDFVQNRFDPQPRILDLLRHFSESQNFWNFWYIFVHPNSPPILAKSVPKLLDLVNPPLIYQKFQKSWFTKSVPKFLDKVQIEAAFFLRSSLSLTYFQSITKSECQT